MATLDEARFRTIVMDRLERGVRSGADHLVIMLKALVSGPGGPDTRRPASVTPFLKVDRQGRVTRRRGEGQYVRRGPPQMRSGEGMRSICFGDIRRDDAAGTIIVGIGVKAGAAGGTQQLKSYMMAHDLGIHYPTIGPAKGTGPVIQHPWLRSGVNHYLPEFTTIVTSVAQGG